jgi:hypothetical protein
VVILLRQTTDDENSGEHRFAVTLSNPKWESATVAGIQRNIELRVGRFSTGFEAAPNEKRAFVKFTNRAYFAVDPRIVFIG